MTLREKRNNFNIQADQNLLDFEAKDERNEEESPTMEIKEIDQSIYTSDKNTKDTGYSFEIGV